MPELIDPREEKACQLRADGKTQKDAFAQAFDVPEGSKANNSSRLFRRADVKARLAAIKRQRAMLADLDAGWALIELRRRVEFNVGDYLTPPNEAGVRYFDIGHVSSERLGLLTELTIEEFTEGRGAAAQDVRRTKIKGPDPIAALSLMARIAGWEAPKKQELTGKDGAPLIPEYSDEDRARALEAFAARQIAAR